MVMLLGSRVVVATAPRHSYVSPVEYDPVDFNLNNWTSEHLWSTMRFTKKEIIVYRLGPIIRLVRARGRSAEDPGGPMSDLAQMRETIPLVQLCDSASR